MKVLVVGSGGREHALCWSLAASSLVSEVLCAPGSDGMAGDARRVPVAADDLEGLVRLARDEAVELVVPGPERPLVLGLVDRLQSAGVRALGPSAAAARLEGSKAFAKDFCARHGIPSARSRTFDATHADAARAWIEAEGAPIVVKADGLAAGKGVTVAQTVEEALDALHAAFAGAFADAGRTVVIEECLTGPEVSLFALLDGETALPFGSARDHKRALDGDLGPNTGGMGAASPVPDFEGEALDEAMATIVGPTVRGLAADGLDYRGILFFGLMLTVEGPKLLEYNVRFGDPECQVLMVRLMTDLGQLLLGAADGTLRHMDLRWYPEPAVGVVLASRGYPGSFERGSEIRGLEAAAALDGVTLFHAATRHEGGRVLADGGRVLTVVGSGPGLAQARARAYQAIGRIDWPDGHWRRDIGLDLMPDLRDRG